MLETLTLDADSATLQQSAEPEVVIDGITFEDDKLWQARYPSLIDYSKVPPGYQMEPAIQIADLERSQMTVRLALAAGYVFQTADGKVKVEWVDGNGSPPPSCISAVLEDPGTCLVTWTREPSSPSTIALRFFCRPETGPEPTDADSVVEGGVYLAFVVREEKWPDEVIRYLEEHPPDLPAAPESLDVKILAFLLPEGRVRYDLFMHDAPDGTEFELAFRVRRGSVLGFDVEIVNLGFVYRESIGDPEDVAFKVTYPGEPLTGAELETVFGDSPSICRVTWTSENTDDESGRSCSFNLFARLEGQQTSFRPVDPTVIEPPRCTNGICVG